MISDIIDLAKKIANTLKTDKANQTLLLERAEEILKELTNRDFSSTNMTIIEEQELAMASLSQAKLLLNSTLSLWNDLSNANKTLDELMGTFGMIHDKTSDILENASLAMDTNNISRSYDSEVSLLRTPYPPSPLPIQSSRMKCILSTSPYCVGSAQFEKIV